jgi:HK97 gp10 family phage protein
MADSIKVEIKGLAELRATLLSLPEKIQHRILRKSLQAGINVLGNAIKERTPVDSGLTKESVGTVVKVSDRQSGGVAVVGFGEQGFRARQVEFGHREVSHTGKEIGHVAPHPWIRPSFDASAPAALDAFVETVRASLPEIAK